jgi:hypothetical protein
MPRNPSVNYLVCRPRFEPNGRASDAELLQFWKEAVVAYLRYYAGTFTEGSVKCHETPQ